MSLDLHLGDCREVMATMPANSVDAVVTDPPYELGFMGKGWDNRGVAYGPATWAAALRVLKPGGHLVAFGAPRTHHRLMVAIEDAGFEIRDCLMWLFGSGFPKSLDVSKVIDKAAGAEREIVGISARHGEGMGDGVIPPITAPATEAAATWAGWGTALKPAYEPIVLARKPLAGTVAGNVLAYGTGGLNVDGCRIGFASAGDEAESKGKNRHADFDSGLRDNAVFGADARPRGAHGNYDPAGRWPANVVLDPEAAALLDVLAGDHTNHANARGLITSGEYQTGSVQYSGGNRRESVRVPVDEGGPSRFYYTAKAGRGEREFGLDDLEPAKHADAVTRAEDAPGSNNPRLRVGQRRNDHPTVKPLDLMRWLCRLITPPAGVILDPFLGSGTTGMAALDEGFSFVGIDLEARYIEIARRRIERRHMLEAMPDVADEQRPQRPLL